jgi:hypothetical protein
MRRLRWRTSNGLRRRDASATAIAIDNREQLGGAMGGGQPQPWRYGSACSSITSNRRQGAPDQGAESAASAARILSGIKTRPWLKMPT